MTPVNIVKNVVNFAVAAGTWRITSSIINNNTNPETAYQKVTNNAAAVVIGTMASDATSDWSDRKIDEFVAWWNQNVTFQIKQS
jgi:hypothetical protein